MVFWNSLAFSMIQWMLAIWSLVPVPFVKPAWTSESSRFTYCWSLACNAGDLGSIPRSGRYPGKGNGTPLQYSCLENPMDLPWYPWYPPSIGSYKSRTRPSDFTHVQRMNYIMEEFHLPHHPVLCVTAAIYIISTLRYCRHRYLW